MHCSFVGAELCSVSFLKNRKAPEITLFPGFFLHATKNNNYAYE
jgi:hypothetical protein